MQGCARLVTCVQIFVRLDCFSHSITAKTAKIHQNEHTAGLHNFCVKSAKNLSTEITIIDANINSFLYFLPTGNEVWGKVMFSKVCVKNSVPRGCLYMMSLPVWLPGPMFQGGSLSRVVSVGRPPESEKWAECFLVHRALQLHDTFCWLHGRP